MRYLTLILLLALAGPDALWAQDSATLSLLLSMNTPLTSEQRDTVAKEVLAKRCFHDWSVQLGNLLSSDYLSGNVDQKPWISRLRLAQIFDWMSTNEIDYTVAWLNRRAQLRDDDRRLTRESFLGLLKNPKFHEMLVGLLGDEKNLPKDQLLVDRFAPEVWQGLLDQEDLMMVLGQNVTSDDYLPGVWRVMADLQQAYPEKLEDYANLAVALAVVFDRGFPDGWPHGQVPRKAIPYQWENWKPLFAYFTEADSDHRLWSDVRKLRTDQLKFMVDAPIDFHELDWANRKVKITRGSFASIFSSIQYNTGRLTARRFDWTGVSYRLEDIQKMGGICVDQAYFSSMAGKAKGLPTLLFTGEGVDGGHAWFGYLASDDKWNMNAGRYDDQNYIAGTVLDPQSWQPISDHKLAFVSAPSDSQVLYDYSRNITLLAELPSNSTDPVKRAAILREALKVRPELPVVWDAVAQAIREHGTPEELQAHYRAMADQFATQDDVRVVALSALLDLQRESGQTEAASQTEEDILSCRADLAIRFAGRLVCERIPEDAEEAMNLYGKLLPKLNQKNGGGGGNLFYDFVAPTVETLADAKHKEMAEKALSQAEPLFRAGSTSMIQDGLTRLHKELTDPGS